MGSTKVKICGITNLKDAKAAIELGANALGFNFYKKSQRYISMAEAQTIVRQLPPTVWHVGVFVNHTKNDVNTIARTVGLDTLQFHGDETVDFVSDWKSFQVIKAIRIHEKTSIEDLTAYESVVDYLMFDRFEEDNFGGTGKEISSELLDQLIKGNFLANAFLSGGLNPKNVREKVSRYNPGGVDVASGVESQPGIKDHALIKKFIEQAKKD